MRSLPKKHTRETIETTKVSSMSEFLVSKTADHQNRHHLVFPDLERLEPPPLFNSPFPNALRPFLRGAMYPPYARFRDRMRRLKKARHAPSSPMQLPLKRSGVPLLFDRSFSLSKEIRKPPPPLRFNTFMTPPPMASKPELRKSVSVSVGRMVKLKSSPTGLFSVRRSFSGLNVLNEIPMVSVSGIIEESRGAHGGNKGSSRIARS